MENYIDLLEKELASTFFAIFDDEEANERGTLPDRKIGLRTIFFGGGTPSLLNPEELDRIGLG